jgi:hypothetical protein
MAVITLAGVQSTALGGAVGGLEVRAFLLNSDGTRTSTGITTTTDSNGRWSLSADTDLSETGLIVARVMNTVTNEIRWVDSGIQVQVTSIVGPNGEAPLAAGSVVATHLASNSVTTAKILNGNVTTAKLADGNVTMEKLHPDVVAALGGGGGGGLSPNSVATVHIQDGAVTNTKLANNSVTGVKIPNGTISEAKLDAGVVAKLNAVGGGGGNLQYFTNSSNSSWSIHPTNTTVLSRSLPAGLWLVNFGGMASVNPGSRLTMELVTGSLVWRSVYAVNDNIGESTPLSGAWIVNHSATSTLNLRARTDSSTGGLNGVWMTCVKIATVGGI